MLVCYMQWFVLFYRRHNHPYHYLYMCGFAFWYRTRMFWNSLWNLSKGCKSLKNMLVCYTQWFVLFYRRHNHHYHYPYMCVFVFWFRNRMFWSSPMNLANYHSSLEDMPVCYMESFVLFY